MVKTSASGSVNNMAFIAIACSWLLSLLLLHPWDEFPLNDDWIYLQVLEHLYSTHSILYTDWISSTLIAHVVWGLLFCLPFGYSIAAARISMLVCTALLAVFSFRIWKRLGVSSDVALLLTALLFFNPVLYVQSLTFMTE